MDELNPLVDGQLLVELNRTSEISNFFITTEIGHSPLTGTTAETTLAGDSPHPPYDPNKPPPCSALTISSASKTSRLRSSTRLSDWLDAPRSETPLPPGRAEPGTMDTQSKDLLDELSNLIDEVEHQAYATEAGSEILPPLRLFELSLESPSLFRPSIEMPSTFSRAPSAKRSAGKGVFGLKDSVDTSQESIYVAATQLPIALVGDSQLITIGSPLASKSGPLVSFPSLQTSQPPPSPSSGSFEIPPTQYLEPAGHLLKVSPRFNEEDLQPSQAIDLFSLPTADSPSHSEKSSIITANPSATIPSQGIYYPFTPHDAVIFPPSEEEIADNPFVDETNAPPSALRKSYENKIPSQKRVQFAPLPQSPEPTPSQGTIIQSSGHTDRQSEAEAFVCDLLSPLLVGDQGNVLEARTVQPSESWHQTPRFAVKSVETESSPLATTKPHSSQSESSAATLVAMMACSAKASPTASPRKSPPVSVKAVKGIVRKRTRPPSSSQKGVAKPPSLQSPIGNATSPDGSLSEHMLVWARWRPLLYAPAILKRRVSRTRHLWSLRFCHWKSDRSCTLPADEVVSCQTCCLAFGDELQIVRHRRKNVREDAVFLQWLEPGSVQVRTSSGGEDKVDLSRIIIKRQLFLQANARNATLDGSILASSQVSLSKSPDIAPRLATKTPIKGKKASRKELLAGYKFWISLGIVGTSSTKRVQKSHLLTRISSLGGVIVNDESTLDLEDPQRVILLSNGYCRTTKTFLALILGVPIVSIEWLNACEQSGTFLPPTEYLVRIDSRSSRDAPKSGRSLMQDWTLSVEGNASFVKSWSTICRAAGATVVDGGITTLDSGRILVQKLPSASSRMARLASGKGVVIITVDWLIDLIISSV